MAKTRFCHAQSIIKVKNKLLFQLFVQHIIGQAARLFEEFPGDFRRFVVFNESSHAHLPKEVCAGALRFNKVNIAARRGAGNKAQSYSAARIARASAYFLRSATALSYSGESFGILDRSELCFRSSIFTARAIGFGLIFRI